MRQCVFVVGTRAQLVKVAPVLTRAAAGGLEHVVWFTGQHDESIDDLISDFGITSPLLQPATRKERASVLRLVTWLPGTLLRCRRYLRIVRDDTSAAPVVVVHGDTLSTLLGALAARLAGGLTVHLESGLSSGKLTDPFPEELLRRLTFRLTRVALCPNDEACARMRRFRGCKVVSTGENTLLDCVRDATAGGAATAVATEQAYIVVSLHRFQNIYNRQRFEKIVAELIELAAESSLVFILHPPTELRLRKYGLYQRLGEAANVSLRPRMPYTDFLALIADARAVISDGGSNQEELSYLGVPTVLLRERTERPDGLGENVVLTDAVSGSLAEFARSGKLDALRRERRLDAAVQPSQTTVDTLLALARGQRIDTGHQ